MTSILSGNLDEAIQNITKACETAGRTKETVTVVAVTKFKTPALIREAAHAGLVHFAESRVQEAQDKFQDPALRALGTWHFIGHLQTNKARQVAELFDVIQSVDSLRLAGKLDEAGAALGRKIRVYAQVNISAEPQKHGFSLETAPEEIQALAKLPHLHLEGLMGMAAANDDPEAARPAFAALHQLRLKLQPSLGPLLVSMGMSHDYTIAVQEGADLVRLGTLLFKAP
jgi:pyridoxal phosphate enzyme (YggS family)